MRRIFSRKFYSLWDHLAKKHDYVSFHYYMCHRHIAIDVDVLGTFCFLPHGFLYSQLFFIAFKFTHPGQIDQLSL